MKLFRNVVNIAYYGALISLPLFLLQLINFDVVFKIVGFVQNNFEIFSYRNDHIANMIIYNINGNVPLRNSGFMWEPKGFANFLLIAIFCRS